MLQFRVLLVPLDPLLVFDEVVEPLDDLHLRGLPHELHLEDLPHQLSLGDSATGLEDLDKLGIQDHLAFVLDGRVEHLLLLVHLLLGAHGRAGEPEQLLAEGHVDFEPLLQQDGRLVLLLLQ